MKNKSLIILGGVLVVAATAVIIKMRSNAATFSEKPKEVGTLLITDKEVPDIPGAITVNDGKFTVNLALKDGKWVVVDRDNFPAVTAHVNELTDTALNLRVQSIEKGVGKSLYGRLGLAEAGGDAKGEEVAKSVILKDSAGKELAGLLVGKLEPLPPGSRPPDIDFSNPDKKPKPQPQPQWIMVKGQDTIYKTVTGFSILSADPRRWLDNGDSDSPSSGEAGKKFFSVTKHKSVSVAGPTPADSWKLTREKEGAELKLDAPAPGEEFDPAKAFSQGTPFATIKFDDILPEAGKAKAALDKPTHTVTIETFDALTYTIKIGAKVEPPKPETSTDPNTPPPTPPEEYYISYSVSGTLNETPPPYPTPAPTLTAVEPPAPAADANDEAKKKYEEDKKKFEEAKKNHEEAVKAWEAGKKNAEESFKKDLQTKKETLAAEQALSSRIFVVQKNVIDPVLKKRSELMKDKPPTPAPGSPTPGNPTPGTPSLIPNATPPVSVAPAPGHKIEAVTPAIEVKTGQIVKPDDQKDMPAPPAPPAGSATPKKDDATPKKDDKKADPKKDKKNK